MAEDRERKARGKAGEAAALRLLEERCGYRIVDTNVRFGARSGLVGEIDIVAWDGPTLCFVEVKTRRSSALARGETPAESVTPAKQRQLARLALAYAARHGLLAEDGPEVVTLRFDVVAVVLASEEGADTELPAVRSFRLLRGAFLAPDGFEG